MTTQSDRSTPWPPDGTPPEVPGTYVTVTMAGGKRQSYRWLAYKRDGARQMGKAGRWQRATEHGWQNSSLPDGSYERVEDKSAE